MVESTSATSLVSASKYISASISSWLTGKLGKSLNRLESWRPADEDDEYSNSVAAEPLTPQLVHERLGTLVSRSGCARVGYIDGGKPMDIELDIGKAGQRCELVRCAKSTRWRPPVQVIELIRLKVLKPAQLSNILSDHMHGHGDVMLRRHIGRGRTSR